MKPAAGPASEADAEQAAKVAEEGTPTSQFGPSSQACALYWDQYVWSWAGPQAAGLEAVPGEAGGGAVELEKLNVVASCPAGAVGLRLICV